MMPSAEWQQQAQTQTSNIGDKMMMMGGDMFGILAPESVWPH